MRAARRKRARNSDAFPRLASRGCRRKRLRGRDRNEGRRISVARALIATRRERGSATEAWDFISIGVRSADAARGESVGPRNRITDRNAAQRGDALGGDQKSILVMWIEKNPRFHREIRVSRCDRIHCSAFAVVSLISALELMITEVPRIFPVTLICTRNIISQYEVYMDRIISYADIESLQK